MSRIDEIKDAYYGRRFDYNNNEKSLNLAKEAIKDLLSIIDRQSYVAEAAKALMLDKRVLHLYNSTNDNYSDWMVHSGLARGLSQAIKKLTDMQDT